MTVAEMLFIITKIIVRQAYFNDVISEEEYTKYCARFIEIEDEECES